MDGSHLADFLLTKDYDVFGLERRLSRKNRRNLSHIERDIQFIPGDMGDQNSLLRALKCSQPREVYNFAAQSFVEESWKVPEETSNITGLGVLRILDAIREYGKDVRFYQASTSELFGKLNENEDPANEDTFIYPRSPYGVSKLYGQWITKNYRESYRMFNCIGIAFNHESERRGFEFVTRKISDGVAKIKLGLSDCISLGNIEVKRDWGYAPEYVEAMWTMLQYDKPDDYVLATGNSYSIKDFLQVAFNHVGITNWQNYVKQDPKFLRPIEINYLCGQAAKIKNVLGWEPKVTFKEIVIKMVDNDMKLLKTNSIGDSNG